MSLQFSLSAPKQKQQLEQMVEESETIEFRLQAVIKGFEEIQRLDSAEAKKNELAQQKLFTASLKKQLAELKP